MSAPGIRRVLIVGIGTTGGWRHADLALASELRARGMQVDGFWPDMEPSTRLRRRGQPLSSECVQAFAIRKAVLRHVSSAHDAVIVSSSTASLFMPRRLRRRTIVWSDTPVRLARTGFGDAILWALERRAMKRTAVLAVQPRHSLDAYRTFFPEAASRTRFLPVPVHAPAIINRKRERFAVIYAGNPEKKGLDLAVQAWAASEIDATLVVTGLDPGTAREFLERRSITVPPNVRLLGRVAPSEHRRLTQSAAAYLSASRREEYGNAQLEALADGAILICGPCAGTAEPLEIAKTLDPCFVSNTERGLARTVIAAMRISEDERRDYQDAAGSLIRAYSPEAFSQSLSGVLASVCARQRACRTKRDR